jgi:hypothetical protein
MSDFFRDLARNLCPNELSAYEKRDMQEAGLLSKEQEKALDDIETSIKEALIFFDFDDLGAEIDVILAEVRKERNVKNTLFPFNALGLGL